MTASFIKLKSTFLALRQAFPLALVLIFGFVQVGTAQNPNFKIFKNFFVTGDYVVAGWVEGASDGSGYAPGVISIPDNVQAPYLQSEVPASVPKGADIVAAYLYWATVEGSQNTLAGQTALFNGYKIQGTILGNPNAPTSWSSGGCSGSSNGSKTMRFYRADVRPYLPVDKNSSSATYGALTANGNIPLRLADSGSNGNTAPFALGASLVVIYRQLAPAAPLNGIVLYDGIIAPSNAGQSVTQTIQGFYQAGTDVKSLPLSAKLTHIVANGQVNKAESVYLNSLNSTKQPLLSIYGSAPPFPGKYGNWDNPTWNIGSAGKGYVSQSDSQEITSIIPAQSNSGCVSWGAIILSTTVQDSDGDGLLDIWEKNQGYTDAVSGQSVVLPNANPALAPNSPDIFVELDYLSNLDGLAGAYRHSHLPKQQALQNVGDLFANKGINVHFDVGSAYQGFPYIIPNGAGGNAVSESLVYCTDTKTALCAFPNQPAIGWKGDFQAFQNNTSLGNFQAGRQQSYHYILSGHSLGAPR
ncbi:MAG: hypothetical protein ACM34E_10390, partial [Acidobacteriota bacterium]